MSKNINPSLVLVQPMKTCPFITERLLTNKLRVCCLLHVLTCILTEMITELKSDSSGFKMARFVSVRLQILKVEARKVLVR